MDLFERGSGAVDSPSICVEQSMVTITWNNVNRIWVIPDPWLFPFLLDRWHAINSRRGIDSDSCNIDGMAVICGMYDGRTAIRCSTKRERRGRWAWMCIGVPRPIRFRM